MREKKLRFDRHRESKKKKKKYDTTVSLGIKDEPLLCVYYR